MQDWKTEDEDAGYVVVDIEELGNDGRNGRTRHGRTSS